MLLVEKSIVCCHYLCRFADRKVLTYIKSKPNIYCYLPDIITINSMRMQMDDIRVPMKVGSMDDIENESISQANSSREANIEVDYKKLSRELTQVTKG